MFNFSGVEKHPTGSEVKPRTMRKSLVGYNNVGGATAEGGQGPKSGFAFCWLDGKRRNILSLGIQQLESESYCGRFKF